MTNDDIETLDETKESPTTGTAFLLWLACIFGLAGVHRFYLKKPWTGLLYLLTFGLFGIGQLVDLFHLRDMVELERHRSHALPPLVPLRRRLAAPRWKVDPAKKLRQEQTERRET